MHGGLRDCSCYEVFLRVAWYGKLARVAHPRQRRTELGGGALVHASVRAGVRQVAVEETTCLVQYETFRTR